MNDESGAGSPASSTIGDVDILIVGAGQAGLALSYFLTAQGRDHVLLERSSQVANAWTTDRWDTFRLVTPNWTLAMPGFPYAGGDPDGFLSRAEIARYFQDYAATFHPPIMFDVEVNAVDQDEAGNGFVVSTSGGRLTANNVVLATGSHQIARLPAAAAEMPAGMMHLHARNYRGPSALPPGAVLVVGSAQTGAQIADELHRSGREVYLSVSSAGRVPRRYRGKDIVRWLTDAGFFSTPWKQWPEPKSRFEAPPHVTGMDGGRTLNLHEFARNGIRLLGRVQGARDGMLDLAPDLHANLARADAFAAKATAMIDGLVANTGLDAPPAEDEEPMRDGFSVEIVEQLDLMKSGVTSIIWATGYRLDFGWVRMPLLDATGFPIQERGVTAVPGLYMLGYFWMHTRGSGTLWGVGKDAEHIAEHLASRADRSRTAHIPLAS